MKVQQPIEHQPSNTLVWAAVAVFAAGAAYFGFASCGGHVGHKKFFGLLAASIAVAAIIAPRRLLHSNSRKVTFLLVLIGGYLLVEAAIAPFYPGPPRSVSEYGSLFLLALEFGPCG